MRSVLDTHIHYAVKELRIRSTLLTSANHKKHQIIPFPDSQMRLVHHYGLYIAIADYDCHKNFTAHLSCILGINDLKYDERRHLLNTFRMDYSSYANLLVFFLFNI